MLKKTRGFKRFEAAAKAKARSEEPPAKTEDVKAKHRRRVRKVKSLDQVRLWALRGAMACDSKEMWQLFFRDEVKELMDLPELLGHPVEIAGYGDVRTEVSVRAIREETEKTISEAVGERTDPAFARLDELAARLALDEAERDLLAFIMFDSMSQAIGDLVRAAPEAYLPACRWLSRTLGHPEPRIREIMSAHGVLTRVGFVDFSKIQYSLSLALRPSSSLSVALLAPGPIIDGFFRRSREASLAVADYPHLAEEIRLATRYLRTASDVKMVGANVLLHGPPGTGKTELARLLASEIGLPTYDVVVADEVGDAQGGKDRMTAYLVCQRALGTTGGAVVLFDEVEDVFPVQHHPFFGAISDKTANKGWLCRVLEENPLPSVWIANTVCHIDPAFLRRFDVVIEVPIPPREVRRRVVSKHFGELSIDPRLVEEIASCEEISPSDVQRAVKVARLAAEDDPLKRADAMRTVLESSLAARGQTFAVEKRAGSDTTYDLSLVRASCDLEQLVGSLGKAPAGTICLYGPPGTGKTAFVKHAAERLGLEVAAHRGSDLLSMWVGQTEARIARMFRSARSGRDLVFLDEADSFLRRRDQAQRSWEVTQVNELLTQMESFDGLFVCATNLLDDLDEAAFRRFGLKIRFDHLDAERRFRFACTELAAIGVPLPDEEITDFRRRMNALDHLSLGDFAAVRKRFRLVAPPTSASAYADALAEERAFKRDVDGRRVGFGR